MEPSAPKFQRIAFDRFEVDLRSGELRKHGRRVRLQGQPFQLLALLLEHHGDVVTREEVCRKLWQTDTFVDFDHSLGTAINKIREALGDSAEHPRFVETMPRRGYRFIGKIDRSEPQAPVQAPTPSSGSSGKYRPRLIFLVSGGLLAAFLLLFFLSTRRRPSQAATSNPPHPIMLAVLPSRTSVATLRKTTLRTA